jgi:predicted amidohydrolase YtcJ
MMTRREMLTIAGAGAVTALGAHRLAAAETAGSLDPDAVVINARVYTVEPGAELMRRCMAYRSFMDAGIVAVAGSDFPPGPFAPLMGMQGMVTRTGWNGETWGAEQRVTVAEALRINTLNGAYASHEERLKGSIAVGKLADYVVLADDPHTVSPDKIKDIKVMRTVTAGNAVYEA